MKVSSIVETDKNLIEQRSRKWHRSLPNGFVSFLIRYNGGIPDKRITINGNLVIERFLCVVKNKAESDWGNWDIDVILSRYDELLVFDGDTIGVDLLPFAQLNRDSYLCLRFEEGKASVGIWSLQGSKEFAPNFEKCFDSFDEFIAILN